MEVDQQAVVPQMDLMWLVVAELRTFEVQQTWLTVSSLPVAQEVMVDGLVAQEVVVVV
jgi:hypothetical protein